MASKEVGYFIDSLVDIRIIRDAIKHREGHLLLRFERS